MTTVAKFWLTSIIIGRTPLDVMTTDLLDITGKPLNYIRCSSLAASVGVEEESLEYKNLPADMKEFVFPREHYRGEGDCLQVWDTFASALFLTMKRYPDKPIRSLPQDEIIVSSAYLDYCIDLAFKREFDPLAFMTRVKSRSLS